jgi:hypothetical protein
MVGLILTWLLVGPSYLQYTVLLTMLQVVCSFLVTVLLKAEVLTMTIGGAFGFTQVAENTLAKLFAIYLGPVLCYLISQYRGGRQKKDKSRVILNPLASLVNPMVVVARRFLWLSFVIATWRLF